MRRRRNYPLERTQVVWHVTKAAQQNGVAKFTGRRIPAAAKCDRAGNTFLARKDFCACNCGLGARTFNGFTGDKTFLALRKWQCDIVDNFGHLSSSSVLLAPFQSP